MIALKLVFQSLAGVGAVVGVAGGGYYAYNLADDLFLLVTATVNVDLPTKDLITSAPPKAVPSQGTINSGAENLLSVGGTNSIMSLFLADGSTATPPQNDVSTPAEESTAITTDLPTESKTGETEETKNYTCKFEKVEDKKCELYSLTFDSTKKSLFSASIKSLIEKSDSLTKVKAKNELKINNFFLLKASSFLHKEWKFDGTKTINLASTEENSKSFSTLTVHAKFELESFQGTTNFAIAKAPETIPTINASDASEAETTITYKCKLEDQDKSACEIVKLSESSLTDISFASISIPATTTKLAFEASSHYLIKWTSESKYSFEDLSSKTITVSKESAGANASTNDLKFTIEAPVMVLPSTGNAALEQVLIIK